MRIFIYYGLRISILFYVFLHILTFFIENTFLLEMLPLFGLAIILFGLLSTPLTKFKLPLFILFISIMILLFSGTQIINGLISGMTEMRNVIGLLVVIPLISSALQEEPYIENLMGVFHDFIKDRKSTRLNSSHVAISYAVFCLKKKTKIKMN